MNELPVNTRTVRSERGIAMELEGPSACTDLCWPDAGHWVVVDRRAIDWNETIFRRSDPVDGRPLEVRRMRAV